MAASATSITCHRPPQTITSTPAHLHGAPVHAPCVHVHMLGVVGSAQRHLVYAYTHACRADRTCTSSKQSTPHVAALVAALPTRSSTLSPTRSSTLASTLASTLSTLSSTLSCCAGDAAKPPGTAAAPGTAPAGAAAGAAPGACSGAARCTSGMSLMIELETEASASLSEQEGSALVVSLVSMRTSSPMTLQVPPRASPRPSRPAARSSSRLASVCRCSLAWHSIMNAL